MSSSMIQVLYFIKYFQEGFLDYFRKVSKCNAIIVFDIEDSVLDSNNPENSGRLKQKYRSILKGLLNEHEEIRQGNPIGIRINSFYSGEFEHDLEMLRELRHIPWDTITIPKVESRSELESIISILNKERIQYRFLGIFAETRKGLANLQDIVSPTIDKLEYVIFGHADFNIDNNIFPFIHHNEVEYWEWVQEIQTKLKETAITYINSPCLFLGDEDMFKANLDRLHQTSIVKYGQMTLAFGQTKTCNTYLPSNDQTPLVCEKKDRVEFARYVIDRLNRKEGDKSFAIDENKHLLTPHEIRMAKQILKKEDKE